jgi:metal-dependent amidase/aminoacylase/carboxypeptidase family protein
MNPREFVDTRTKRCMAQTLEELEVKVEHPLQALVASGEPITPERLAAIVAEIDAVKRIYRKKIQALSSDCLDLMPSDLQINGYEPLARR